jgi:hypothetical protein
MMACLLQKMLAMLVLPEMNLCYPWRAILCILNRLACVIFIYLDMMQQPFILEDTL